MSSCVAGAATFRPNHLQLIMYILHWDIAMSLKAMRNCCLEFKNLKKKDIFSTHSNTFCLMMIYIRYVNKIQAAFNLAIFYLISEQCFISSSIVPCHQL